MTKDEALDLALEVLESERDKYLEWGDEDGAPDDVYEAITAIKQARSAPVQEPEAVPKIEWVNTSSDWVVRYLQAKSIFNAEQIGEMMDFAALAANKFYTTPPAQPAPVQVPSNYNEFVETACALIKAADDAAADRDYMLDSDDCIRVLRGEWKGEFLNDMPKQPTLPAAPVQEPVAWRKFNGFRFDYIEHQPALSGMVSKEWKPLYDTTPPAQPAPVQEPVARVSLQWLAEMILSDCGHSSNYTPLLDRVKARIEQWERANSAPTPPAAQRPWFGLTDEEILKLAYPIRWQEVDDFEADKAVNFAQMVEAKLKEKNT